MNINELFEEIQDNFYPEDLNGEFTLHGNVIIWTYDVDKDSEEIAPPSDDEDDDYYFEFESTSSEELLLEAYQNDLDKIQELLDELEEIDNWTFSDYEIIDNVISFKIF